MKTLLLITTLDDLSFPLFFTQNILSQINIHPLIFTESKEIITQTLKNSQYDLIYLRDPFNSKHTQKEIKSKLEVIFQSAHSPFLDHLTQTEDLYFEDKWTQYQTLSQFMPETRLVDAPEAIDFDTHFVKKRLSSRAKGIVFEPNKIKNPQDYVIQTKLNIKIEYRINIIGKQIIEPINPKQHKTKDSKVKILPSQPLTPQLKDFCHQIMPYLNYDFYGLDVAETDDGTLQLIEVNRSPQFKAIYRENKTNCAEKLIEHIS